MRMMSHSRCRRLRVVYFVTYYFVPYTAHAHHTKTYMVVYMHSQHHKHDTRKTYYTHVSQICVCVRVLARAHSDIV